MEMHALKKQTVIAMEAVIADGHGLQMTQPSGVHPMLNADASIDFR
jgi:hypothetical protein